MRSIETARDQRGVTLMELLAAVAASAIVLLGIGSFYVKMQSSYDQGNAQSIMQRQATFVQDELARVIAASNALLAGTCGPSGTAGLSLPVQIPAGVLPDTPLASGGFVCFYYRTSPNELAECRFTSAANRACISGTTQNLLSLTLAPGTMSGAPWQTILAAQQNPSGTLLDVFTLVGGSAVDVRFRLSVQVLGPTETVGPMDFTTRVAVKNG